MNNTGEINTGFNLERMVRNMNGKGGKWIQGAVPASHRGVFKKKAQAAGMSTGEFAEKEAHAPGKLGKQARLAETLMGINHAYKRMT